MKNRARVLQRLSILIVSGFLLSMLGKIYVEAGTLTVEIGSEGGQKVTVNNETFTEPGYVAKDTPLTIAATPADNYEFSSWEVDGLEPAQYSLLDQPSFEFNMPDGDVYIAAYFSAIEQIPVTEQPSAQPTTSNDDTSDSGSDSESQDTQESDITGNVSVSETFTDKMVLQMNKNSDQTVFELDYTKQSNLTLDDFVKLCKTRNDAARDCHFIGDDRKMYTLHIPANIDTESDDFKTCLETFRAYPYNGVAGPAAIATIFESFGITCTQLEEIAINDASVKLLEVEHKIAPSLVVAQNNLINQKNDLINQKNSLTKQLENTQKSLNEAITVRDKYQEKYKNATKSGKSEAPSRAQELSRNNAIGDGNGGYIAQGGHVQINGGKSNVTFTLAAPTSGVLSSANKYANSVGGTLLHCVTTSSPGVSFKTATVNFTVTGVYANDTIAVYQLQGKNWVQVLVSSITDNHVTVNLTQHGPLAFVRVAAVATETH